MSVAPVPSPWPFRLALATALSAVPLVLFGGSVTTIGAGMAVEGWLIAEGHFLVFFPIDSWLRDTATFVEHTHRLFGVLVGLLAIATVVATFLREPRRAPCLLAVLTLLAVCGQGALGGFRVLENSPQLAFLHGAAAQAVLALLGLLALILAPSARRARPARASAGLRHLATLTAVVVYGQIVLGAWYRHALRPAATPEASLRFLLHVGGALVVAALVLVLARGLERLGARRTARGLLWLLGVQVALGLAALAGYRPGAVGPVEWTLAIAHVLGGGLLFFQVLSARVLLGRAPLEPATGPSTRHALSGGVA